MAGLLKELKRRNVFKVAVAYLALGWVVVQVTSLAVPALNLPAVLNTIVFYLGLIGFPFALFFAWVFELTPEGVRKTTELDTPDAHRPRGQGLNYLIIGLMAIGLAWFAVDKFIGWNIGLPALSDSRDASIAVLPFVDMSEGGENQYLGDGIAEEILNALVGVSGLKVASRTSAFSFRGDTVKADDIGDALHVRHVLEGSVRKAGDRIRVTAQLIDVETGFHLFSRQLDRKSKDLFAIENEIAQEIVKALKPSLGVAESGTLVKRLTDNPAAQELRMKARYAFFDPSQDALDDAVSYIYQALELDPQFWQARGELAYAHVYRAFYGPHVGDMVSAARQAAITLEHDPHNGPALLVHAAQAAIVDRDQALAGGIYERMLANPPSDRSILVFNYSNLHLLPNGEYDEAIAILLEEEGRNPLAGNLKLGLVQAYFAAGDYLKCAEKLEQLRAMTRDHWAMYTIASNLLLQEGKPQEALQRALQGREHFGLAPSMLIGTIVKAYLQAGQIDGARQFMADTVQSYREGTFLRNVDIAFGFVALGDYEEAEKWINRSLDLREPNLLFYIGFIRVEEGFNRSAIFTRLLEIMNLAPMP